MKTRECSVVVEGKRHDATFHQFGCQPEYGDGTIPVERTVAIVELADGQVMQLPPEKIKFLDKPE